MLMNRRLVATSTLAAAVTLAIVAQTAVVRAADDKEKCYGINAAGKNDCKAGAHDCAGHATKARDPQSFVLVPAGACSKIAGGSTKSG
jgi:uncharacterized membrane protein